MDREDCCPFVAECLQFYNHLRTFWFKCVSLISLVTYNDPEIVHFTFSMTFLS